MDFSRRVARLQSLTCSRADRREIFDWDATAPPLAAAEAIDSAYGAESNMTMIIAALTIFHVLALLFVTFSLVNTGFNIFIDLLFATFPVPIIRTLKMKRELQLYLVGILSLGYFAVGVVKAVYQINVTFSKETDKTFRQSIHRILKLNTTNDYNTPAKYGSKYGYGPHSRNAKITNARSDTATGQQGGGIFQGIANEFDVEAGIRVSAEDGNTKVEMYSIATSFCYHGSADGSGSEGMILGAKGVAMPPKAVESC
ncbi:hypothetical protein VTI74DRAFT_10995 [Chaetomium olivicolor]